MKTFTGIGSLCGGRLRALIRWSGVGRFMEDGMTDDNVVSINETRAEKECDNTLWSPMDCVRAVARDMSSGLISPDTIFVMCVKHEPDGSMMMTRYRANLKHDHEIALLAVASTKAISAWVNE
jgi:hypothetical protein